MKKHLLSTGALVWYFNTFIPYSIQRIDVNLEKLSRDVLVISVISFYLFTLFMGFSRQEYWVVCHSLLQWITFCQTSPPQPICLGWPHTAWLSFIELDKAVVLWSDGLVFCECGFSLSALCGKFWKRWEYKTASPASWETCMQVRKQQLELDMEQQIGSK